MVEDTVPIRRSETMNDKAQNSLLYLDGVTVSFDGFRR